MGMDLSKIPDHCRQGLALYLDLGIIPGEFLQAVITNDLVGFFSRADDININHAFDYANVLYNEMPSDAWGSKKKMLAWSKKGGLLGKTGGVTHVSNR